MKAEHLRQGKDAENSCCNYLQSQGLKLIERNFSCRLGEIDIIMSDGNMLVFVEVRFRKNINYGNGLESITPLKQQKLRKTAELYMLQNDRHRNARFDVVSMSMNTQNVAKDQPYTFEWIKNAFC